MRDAIKLSAEAQALLKQLVQERDAANMRLEVAVLSMRAALGVPIDWQLNSLEDGFTEVNHNGNDS